MEIPTTLSLPSIPRTSPSVSLASCNSVFFNNGGTDLLKKRNCLALSRSRAQTGFKCRCMFGLGVPEIVVIAGVTTLLFGPKKLPEVGRAIGQTVKSFQKAAKEFESELKKESELAIEPPAEKPIVASEEEELSVKVSSKMES